MYRWKIVNLVFLVVLLLAGCATRSAMLPARELGGESDTPVMVALESYRGEGQLFVKYRSGDRILYTAGSWRDRLELSEFQATEKRAIPSLLPMQFHQEEPWESLPADAASILILSIDQWQMVRDRMLRAAVPPDGTGLVVDFEHTEFFLYYDPSGQFHAMRLLDKPAEYRVHDTLHFIEFMRRGRPILEAFLQEQGITQTEFVFNTGDTGLYSLPFLYLDTEHQIAVFLRNMPLRPVTITAVAGMKSGQAFGHLLKSTCSTCCSARFHRCTVCSSWLPIRLFRP